MAKINQDLVDDNGTSYANSGMPMGRPIERTFMCDICGLAYRESKFLVFRGKYYGIPCGCHHDVPDILMRENRDGNSTDDYRRMDLFTR
jgi:hypothetical protein